MRVQVFYKQTIIISEAKSKNVIINYAEFIQVAFAFRQFK